MRKFTIFVLALFSGIVFSQKVPEINKVEFSNEALNQKITSLEGKKFSISEVIKKHEGRILIIDFWASWCQDCILALPATKELKEKNPELDFVYFSLDRSYEQWKRGLAKYNITDQENYWFDEGWKNSFNNYIDLNWVPRFMVIDQTGKIAKYYSIHPSDPEIQKTINELKLKTL
ncbi:TlpA family protein disulfide reductase [Kaistella antarctica]|uniref:Alkyl hydroperoxide reductase n=1 Tax=Kaistella antarctica TaxID=266748 RepID=A0A448NML9_9FLAO|nr:thioredoxin-like domain-containing protein [Kaistella antarctica]KEY20045.1 alkyl hydroperoxide reductase [Kaistella antarctica]SEV94396.1 Thiol-disulfide isomerase or thioredoxin [Kaistella antarctica]VEH95578.1 thiol-disulfide oxidoreductase [Kaistella antarctica]